MKKPAAQKRMLRALALVLTALVTAGVFFGAVRVRRFRYHLSSAQIGFAQLESALSDSAALARLIQDPGELTGLRTEVAALRANVAAMKELGHPLLAPSAHLGWLPRLGGDIAAAPHLLDLADQTCEAALSLIDGIMPLAGRLGGGILDYPLVPQIIEALQQAQPDLLEAQYFSERASAARQAIIASRLSPRTRSLVDRFDARQPAFSLGLETLRILPALLGADEVRRYLILAQNSDELRATGGFISGVGRVEVSRGRISSVMFEDSYAVGNPALPHPQPPEPLRRYMDAEMLLLRDANWWPDFPTSARQIAELYMQAAGQPVDGVFGVDLTTLELLVQAMGQIEVQGYPKPITAENLHSTLIANWAAPPPLAPAAEISDVQSRRKDFAGDLARALIEQAMTRATLEQLVSISRTLGHALAQRHAQIYVNDPVIQDVLRRAHWDGALRESPGDFLMVVDSNIGFNKANPNVLQTLSYEVILDKTGVGTSLLTLTYHHQVENPLPACIQDPHYGDSYRDLMERCYWDYLRVYIPLGSELVALTGSDSPADISVESGRTVIGTSFLLETGQARTIQLTYHQDAAYDQGSYALVVQKQAGTDASALRVTVQPPEPSQLLRFQPEPRAAWSDKAVWQGVLDTDWEIAVQWQSAGQPAGK